MAKKNYVLITMKADGTLVKVVQRGKPTLTQLQQAVGGYIEIVPYFARLGEYNRGTAYCNEEGKIKRPSLPYNANATRAWEFVHSLADQDNLVGDVLFVAKTDEEVGRYEESA
jgi:hypothetical protein